MAHAVSGTGPSREPLPRSISRALARVDRRLASLALLRALGTSTLIAAVIAALAMAADLVWGLPRPARLAIWGVWLLGSVAPIARAAVRKRPRSLALAALLERGDPAIGDRLTGAVDLLGDGPAHGSPALIAALAADASEQAIGTDPARALPSGGSRRRFALGTLALALVAAPSFYQEDPFGRLAQRFLTPWVDLDLVRLYTVQVEPGDAVLAIGDSFNVRARVAPRFGRSPLTGDATIEWSLDGGRTVRRGTMEEGEPQSDAPANPDASGVRSFWAGLRGLSGSLKYRVVTRSGESRWHRVSAVPRPMLKTLTARIEPPEYTRLAAFSPRDSSRIDAWEGSKVTLTFTTATPLRAAVLTWPIPSEAKETSPISRRIAAEVTADGRTAIVLASAEVTGDFEFSLVDTHGLSSLPSPPRRLNVRLDQAPTVALRGTDGLDEAKPDDTVRFGVDARDDVAVGSLEVHYAVERGSDGADAAESDSGILPIVLPGLGTPTARGQAALPLALLKLKPGDAVAYRVRVTDNRPAPRGPNVGWSPALRVVVSAKAEPLADRRDRLTREAVQKSLDELKKAAAENRKEAEQLRYAADAAQRGNGEWDRDRQQALADREAEAKSLGDRLQTFARQVAEEPAFRPLARPARQLAAVEAEAARATLDQARQADSPARRFADLRQADARLAAVANRLEDLQRDLNGLSQRGADRNHLQTLADRQSRVAEKADRPDQGRAGLDQVAAEQNAVRKELDDLLKKSPDLRAGVLANQAAEAKTLAERARALAERQREEARNATDLSRKTEVLKALANDQRALEDAARLLALDVDQPLAENGRGRLNVEPARQAAAPIERGDLPQARQHLLGSEAELRRLSRDLEDAPSDLKALARRLAQRQEKLNNEVAQALGELRFKTSLKPDERKPLVERLAPLVERQKALAELARAALDAPDAKRPPQAEPRFPMDAAKGAAEAAERAGKAVNAPDNPREVEDRGREAQNAFHRLANELPDPWKREEPFRRAFDDARRDADAVAHDAERHLRETDRPNDDKYTPANRAFDLSRRLESLAARAKKAADRLDAADPASRFAPHRDRAARRARALAEAVDAAREQAPKNPAAPAGFDPVLNKALRDGLETAAVGSRASFERLAQKLNNGLPDDDLAAELAEDQRTVAGPEDQRRIASALRAIQAPDAPLEHAEAVRLADLAAKGHDPKGKPEDQARAAELASKAVEALADRLNDRQSPRARAEALARAERGLNDPEAPHDAAAEAARQRAVAAELARLARVAKGDAAKPAEAADEAVRRAGDLAAQALQPGEPDPGQPRPTAADRAVARDRAAEALDALAARLPEEPAGSPKRPAVAGKDPVDPELPLAADHAAKARDLARRERQLRERLQAVLGERAAPQQAIAREAAALGRDLANLRDRATPLSDRSRGPAAEAASLLGEQAPRAMAEAAGQLAQGQPDPARGTQRRAAELAERGAQNAEDLAAVLRADSGKTPDAPQAASALGDGPESLAAAREAMDQAARSLGKARNPGQSAPNAMDAARKAAHNAAEQLQAAARASQGQGDGEGPPEGPAMADASVKSGQPGEPKGNAAGVAQAETLRDLQDAVRKSTGRNWGELPGHLRTEILQMSQGRYRDDYARLIQLYFREIAAGADGKP